MIDRLDCTVMPYAWGSRTAIAELQGRPSPAPGPEAELWMGAHPVAPSRLARHGQPTFEKNDPLPPGPAGRLSNIVSVWDDGTSSVSLTKRSGSTPTGGATL